MNQRAFVSHAQNGEDVVLWRALRHISNGRYIDVGANHPEHDSISRAFYDMGWTGVLVEPMPDFAALLRQERPGDDVVQAAIVESAGATVTLHAIDNSGLSTLRDDISDRHATGGFASHDIQVAAVTLNSVLSSRFQPGDPIHFMTIDVEGAEADVLATLDLDLWRPWIVVVESTAPLSTVQTHEAWISLLTDRGYVECLFDGLSRYFCAPDQLAQLGPRLSYPACVLDGYETAEVRRYRTERDTARNELLYWRGVALHDWSGALRDAVSAGGGEQAVITANLHRTVADLRAEIVNLHTSTSWRVTAPLRGLKAARNRARPPQ